MRIYFLNSILLAAGIAVALTAIEANAASKGIGGGTAGYTCSTDTFPGDGLPGRSCICVGDENSADCRRMRREVCKDEHIDLCSGPMGGDVTSCECHWKAGKPTTPTLKLPGKLAPKALN